MMNSPLLARLALSVGAGLAAALLFIVPIKGTTIGFFLAYFAPLPIMIAALGWGHATGLVATGVGALTLALALHPMMAGLFAVALGLPAWRLAQVTLFARDGEAGRRWYPIPAIVTQAALLGAGVAMVAILSLAFSYGGYGKAVAQATKIIAQVIESFGGQMFNAANPLDTLELARVILAIAPAALAGSTMGMLLVNLWLAARIVQKSHRLPRPWADIPTALVLPPSVAAVFALSLVLCALPGLAGATAMVAAAASGLALALHGLAALHAHSRGNSLRAPMLSALYAVSFIFTPLPLVLALVVGLADIAFALRRRAAPPSPQT